MSNFRVGMVVACIKDSMRVVNYLGYPPFRKGEILTISGMERVEPWGLMLYFVERSPNQRGHHLGFRPLVTCPTSIEFARKILRDATKEVELT